MLPPIRITDDRGQTVTLFEPDRSSIRIRSFRDWIRAFRGPQPEQGRSLTPVQLAEWDFEQQSGGVYGAVIGFSVILACLIGLQSLFPGSWHWLLVSAGSAAIILASLEPLNRFTRWFMRRHTAEKLRRAYIASNQCPACAFCLTGLQPDVCGLIQCPECGAAWRLSSPTPA